MANSVGLSRSSSPPHSMLSTDSRAISPSGSADSTLKSFISLALSAFLQFRRTSHRFHRFHRFHDEWSDYLRNKLLPRLTRSLSSPTASLDDLSLHVAAILRHFQKYYYALDRAATPSQVPFLLNPPWRAPPEKPFLFIGDLHPNLFTNLLRSFLDNADLNEDDDFTDYDQGYHLDFRKDGQHLEKQWQIATAWKNPNKSLMSRVEEIERGLRLMIPALLDRMKEAQMQFVDRVGINWPNDDCNKMPAVVREAAESEMEELARVFKDVNRLRHSTLSEIVGPMTAYEAALFLQALAQFVLGLRSPEPAHHSKCTVWAQPVV